MISTSKTDFLPSNDEDTFDDMIDDYNDWTERKRIWRRLRPNWEYRRHVLRRPELNNHYDHLDYSKYRPELFDWEKALAARERGEKLHLKSRTANSQLTIKERNARGIRCRQIRRMGEMEKRGRDMFPEPVVTPPIFRRPARLLSKSDC